MRRLLELTQMTRRELETFASSTGGRYRSFDEFRPKKNKWRHYDDPEPRLKRVQKRVARWLHEVVVLPPEVVGGVPGRSTRDHAALHCAQSCVVTMDLRDFFPRTCGNQFGASLLRRGVAPDVTAIVQRLVIFRGYVPQGAPSSNLVANIAALPMFESILSATRDMGLSCSFYVDDIAVSGLRAREAIEVIAKIVSGHGHSIRPKKTTIVSRASEQLVVGHAVNGSNVGVGRSRRDDIVEWIRERASAPSLTEGECRSLKGKLKYVEASSESQATRLARFAELVLGAKPVVEGAARRAPDGQRRACPTPKDCRAGVRRR